MLSCSAFDLRQTYVRAQVSNLLEITLSPNPHSPNMISPANVKRHIWQRFSGFPLPSRGRHLGSCPCIQSSCSLKLPWNSGGFHLTAESAGHTENQERRQNSTCRTQNGTTESIPQTITTQPFSSNWDILFIDEIELTADSDRSYSTHRQDKYEYKMSHRTNTAQNAHLSWKMRKCQGALW